MYPFGFVPDTVFAGPTLVEPLLVRLDHLQPVVLLAAPLAPDAAPDADEGSPDDTLIDE